MSYKIYLVESLGMPRNHHMIFVETDESGPHTGHAFHAIGNIQNGMEFENRPEEQLETSATFLHKKLLGNVSAENYSRVFDICRSIPAPKKQFNGPQRLYPTEPLRRCQEWANEAIKALSDAGIVDTTT